MTETTFEELLYVVENLGGTPGIITVPTEAEKPDPNPSTDAIGRWCVVVATKKLYFDTGATWEEFTSSAVFSGTSYRGTWNASTNTPALTSSTGTQGHYYLISTAGTTTLDTIASWTVGDWAIFNGTIWQKATNIFPLSTEGAPGIIELATPAETTAGLDTLRAVHPAGLKVELDKKANAEDVVGSIAGVSSDGGDIGISAGANISITTDDAANIITIATTSLPLPYGSDSGGFFMRSEIAVDGAGLDATGGWIDDEYIGGRAGHTDTGFYFDM